MTRRLLRLLLALGVLWTLAGCTTSTTSTTPRTAVEMALLSETAEDTISQLKGPMVYYNRFYLDATEFEAYDQKYTLAAIRSHLLKLGMHSADSAENADVIVYPRSAVAAIDESKFLIGIPEIPIVAPGAGTMKFPELALFKRHKQIGRNKTGLLAIDQKDRNLAFDFGIASSERYYTRWTILIFLSFDSTDLGPPYRKVKKEKVEE